MSDKKVTFTMEEWAATKPEAFQLTDEQLKEVTAAELALFEVLEKHNIPATLNIVVDQDAEGASKTRGFVVHGSVGRSTLEIIMGGVINTHSGVGLAEMLPSLAHYVMEKNSLITGSSIIDRI